MASDNTKSPSARLSTWAYACITLYAVAGHFAGNEHSFLAGAALTAGGLATGWWVAQKLAAAPAVAKGVALVAPLAALALLGLATRPPAAPGRRVLGRELNGTWVSYGSADRFTLRVNGDSAWLSVAAGLQNVGYHATWRGDSVVLRGGGSPLRWRLAQDTTRHAVVIVAGEGLYFLKARSQ